MLLHKFRSKADKKLYIACKDAIGKAAARELHQSPNQDACNMPRTAIHLREHILDSKQRFDGECSAIVWPFSKMSRS